MQMDEMDAPRFGKSINFAAKGKKCRSPCWQCRKIFVILPRHFEEAHLSNSALVNLDNSQNAMRNGRKRDHPAVYSTGTVRVTTHMPAIY